MESQCLSLRDLPHITKLHSLFLEDFSKVSKFYAHPPTLEGLRASAAQVRLDAAARATVVAALRDENARLGPGGSIDASVARNLDRLAAGAVAIVTGQQVGLFSGPAYSFYKALTTTRVAQEITLQGVDAVPVFWLASEDHDLAEVDHCFWPGPGGLQRLVVVPAAEVAGRRVGEIELGQGIAAALGAATDALDGPESEEIAAALKGAYSAHDSFSSAFGKLMARLLRGRGIILLDPLEPRLQALASRVYRQALAQNSQLIPELIARNKALEAAGLHTQVRVGERGTLLFSSVAGRRTPLRAKNGAFAAGDSNFSLAQLEDALENSPGSFSANVLLRPVVQDSLLPTAGYVAGPAEAAYFAQASVVYQRLLGRMPAILPRAGFTLVEPRVARLLRKHHLDVRDIFRGRQHVRARLERESIPRELARHFATGDKNLRRYLARLRRTITRLDATLAGALSTAERKMLYQLEKLRAKAGRAADFRAGLLDSREQTLRDALYPHHGLQERALCLLPFIARHGAGLLDELERRALPFDAASPRSCHQVLFL
jgi:bacillithiol biosynthesis cysteine-adding enzyme BshC